MTRCLPRPDALSVRNLPLAQVSYHGAGLFAGMPDDQSVPATHCTEPDVRPG